MVIRGEEGTEKGSTRRIRTDKVLRRLNVFKTCWRSLGWLNSYETESGHSGGVINTLGVKGAATRSLCIVVSKTFPHHHIHLL